MNKEQKSTPLTPQSKDGVTIDNDKTIRNRALELLNELGVSNIYYTTDGYWFTKEDLAKNHAREQKVEIKHYKNQ